MYFRPVYCEILNYVAPAGATTFGAAAPPTMVADAKSAAAPTTLPNTTSTVPTTTPTPSRVPLVSPASTAQAQADCSATNDAELPTRPVADDTAAPWVILPYYDKSVRYILGPADMNGAGVSNTAADLTAAGQYEVHLTFTSKGATEFDKIASDRYRTTSRIRTTRRTRARKPSSSTGSWSRIPLSKRPASTGPR
jgi:hypothetical protein